MTAPISYSPKEYQRRRFEAMLRDFFSKGIVTQNQIEYALSEFDIASAHLSDAALNRWAEDFLQYRYSSGIQSKAQAFATKVFSGRGGGKSALNAMHHFIKTGSAVYYDDPFEEALKSPLQQEQQPPRQMLQPIWEYPMSAPDCWL